MNFLALIPFLGTILDKLLPDKGASDAAKLELVKMAQTGELAALAAETDLAKGQQSINQVEASSTRLFVAGWRPFVGWICGCGLAWDYILAPMIGMICQASGHPIALPKLDNAQLVSLLFGLLGLGGLRSVEKVKGVA